MIRLKAIQSNPPFYFEDDIMQKEEWLKKLNLTEQQFEEINAHFMNTESNITCEISHNPYLQKKLIVVQRTGLDLTEDESNAIKAEIDEILKKYNIE